MGKIGEKLLFELGPRASGDDCYFDDAQEVMQQRGRFGGQGRLTGRQGSVQIEHNEFLHSSPSLRVSEICVRFRTLTKSISPIPSYPNIL